MFMALATLKWPKKKPVNNNICNLFFLFKTFCTYSCSVEVTSKRKMSKGTNLCYRGYFYAALIKFEPAHGQNRLSDS